MKIAVCIKKVPDTALNIKIGADGKSIDKSDIEYVISPYDEIAIEHAVRIKEKNDNVEVIILSLGDSGNEKYIRTGLAMGGDRGVLLETDRDTFDSYTIAKAIADQLKEENPDLILFGIKAVDDDNYQVGAIVSNLLGIPFLSTVTEFEIKDNIIKAQSEIEGGHLELEASLPCAISIQKGSIEPRICSLIKIRKARKKELKKISVSLPEDIINIEKMELPPQRVGGKIIGEGADVVPKLFQLLKEEAKVL